jgi:hypothetical protein
MRLNAVVIREPRSPQLPITVGVRYPEELRSVRTIELTVPPGGFRLQRAALLGEGSVKLFDEVLGLLFAHVRTVPLDESDSRDVAAIVEPRLLQATLSTKPHRDGQIFMATIEYGITLYSVAGERLASTTAMLDAAWNFMRGFRDGHEIRRSLERAVLVERGR